ncbi:MAG TPA: LPS assembly lipoprotein LptE [Rhizomicrobium sp.]|nr:LPS assembly lipoprotein LptE [Rhizomicrobium sp.]
MRAAGIAFACIVLVGCGFHPMYGGGGKLGPELASIYVEPVTDNDGYELRNQLIDLLGSDGRQAGKSYFLKLTLAEESNGVALQNDATITRYNDTLSATYVLTDANGKQVTSGTQISLASYNVSNAPYSTLVVQKDSDRRAAEDLADRIRMDLGAYFSGHR